MKKPGIECFEKSRRPHEDSESILRNRQSETKSYLALKRAICSEVLRRTGFSCMSISYFSAEKGSFAVEGRMIQSERAPALISLRSGHQRTKLAIRERSGETDCANQRERRLPGLEHVSTKSKEKQLKK